MGTQQKGFYPKPVDRTPYSSCAVIAALVAFIVGGGAVFLWNTAGTAKHARIMWRRSGTGLPSQEDLVQQVKDAANGKSLQEQKDAALEAAKQEAERRVQEEIQRQTDQIKENVQEGVKKEANQQLESLLR
jgi:hypothetical protein